MEMIIADILRREGGFVHHPADKGGATNFGITQAALGEWRALGRPASPDEVRTLRATEAADIYKDMYITRPGFAFVTNAALLGLLVDCGVHSGPARAVKWLQNALKVTPDGVIGEVTRAAYARADDRLIYKRVLGERVRFLGRLITASPSQAAFAAGWMNRVSEFVEAA